eukprot:scaffold6010_cov121-Isochrysis_galbana.AAC.2
MSRGAHSRPARRPPSRAPRVHGHGRAGARGPNGQTTRVLYCRCGLYPTPSPKAQVSCHVLSLDGGPSADHRPMDGRFLLLVLGFAPCPVLPFAREKARQL